MELVPFYDKWTDAGTKLDLKGVYRRPGPGRGYSLALALPLRRHSDWAAKGFEFVTLSTLADLGEVANDLRARGVDPLTLRAQYDRSGAFDVARYMREQQATDAAALVDLQAKVDKYGADTVRDLMRMQDPGFEFPAEIRLGEALAADDPTPAKKGGRA